MTLHQRENGVYYVVYRDHRKKQIWKSLGTKDASMAKRLYNQFKKSYLEGKIARIEDEIKSITIQAFADEYIDLVETTGTYNTWYSTKYVFKKFVEYLGGDTQVKNIKAKDIDDYIIHAKRSGNKPVSINKDLRTLKAAFNKAIEYEYIKINPIKKMLRVDKMPPKAITSDQFNRILNKVADPLFTYFILFITYTGCRKSEALAVTWADIDRRNGVIQIRKTKSHEARYIPISDKLGAVLDTMNASVGRLFPWGLDWVGRRFKQFADDAGVHCTLHGLRHTFATILANSETPLRVLQDLMGHKDIQSTMIYISARNESKEKAVEKIDL